MGVDRVMWRMGRRGFPVLQRGLESVKYLDSQAKGLKAGTSYGSSFSFLHAFQHPHYKLDMDDADEKVRRNLVVFSSLILASAWLGHPELWLVTQLLTPDAARPPAWKVKSLALAVLVYLTARYWFSLAHEEARTSMGHEWHRIKTRIRDQTIRRGVARLNRTNKPLAFITTNMDEYLREEADKRGVAQGEKFLLKFSTVDIRPQNDWAGELHTTREFARDTSTGLSSGGAALSYDFPLGMRRLIRLHAAMNQLFYSRTAVEYFTPVGLSVFAFLVLTYRLVAA